MAQRPIWRGHLRLALVTRDIDHSRIKTKSPQTNGICERFHRTLLEEFYRAGIPQKDYQTIDELQADLDAWIGTYNHDRPHQSRWCYVANEKLLTTADMSDGSYRQQ